VLPVIKAPDADELVAFLAIEIVAQLSYCILFVSGAKLILVHYDARIKVLVNIMII